MTSVINNLRFNKLYAQLICDILHTVCIAFVGFVFYDLLYFSFIKMPLIWLKLLKSYSKH